ncbi:MAG: glutathione S-transferase family protein [Gammaproteobacteria bacterium]
MKIYHFPFSPNSRRVLAVAFHLGLEPELIKVDLGQGEQMGEEFLKLNPNHAIPVLVDSDFVLWESVAIMQYLANQVSANSLWPAEAKAQADVSRWLCWSLAHWGPACGFFIFERLVKNMRKLGDPDPVELKKGEERLARYAPVLDDHLKGREWLCGGTVTLADFTIGSYLELAEAAHYPVKPYAEIWRWYRNIESLPEWQRSAPKNFS